MLIIELTLIFRSESEPQINSYPINNFKWKPNSSSKPYSSNSFFESNYTLNHPNCHKDFNDYHISHIYHIYHTYHTYHIYHTYHTYHIYHIYHTYHTYHIYHIYHTYHIYHIYHIYSPLNNLHHNLAIDNKSHKPSPNRHNSIKLLSVQISR
jgi:hypothetical protein